MDFEKLYKASLILTAAGAPAAPGALAVKDGRVAALVAEAEIPAAAAAGVPVINLGAAVILPGLWDAHVHLLSTGLSLGRVDLTAARSLDDVFDLLRAQRGGTDELFVAVGLDDSLLAENRLPSGAELDAVSPARPLVVVRVDSHSLIANAAARRFLEVDARWPGVELDEAGAPTGRIRGRAHELTRRKMHERLTPARKKAAYEEAAALAVSRGVVALCALEGAPLYDDDDLLTLLACRDELPVEVFVYPQIPRVATVRKLGLPRLGGCILVDGSLGSRTAALAEPYADEPTTRGELYFADDDLNALALGAHAAGLQVALHAIGDRAVTQVLNAYELAGREHPRADARHRLEHGELTAPRTLERMAASGIILSAQPAFEWYWGGPAGMYEQRLGAARRRLTNRLKSALRAGVALAGGSDADITPIDPLLGVAAAMAHPTPEERLTFAEALAAFTTGAAHAVFAEKDWGALDAGKWASFTAVAADPRALPPGELARLGVVATVVKGEVVFKM